MLRIYSVALEMCRDASSIARAIEKHDRDLAQQLRRAATSVVLNIAEAAGSFGGHRKQRYHSALGSAYEVLGLLRLGRGHGVHRPGRAASAQPLRRHHRHAHERSPPQTMRRMSVATIRSISSSIFSSTLST